MKIVDSHCHLYMGEFKNDLNEVMERAKKAGVVKFFLPAVDSETHAQMLELEKKYPEECFAMMGLHPCSVKENFKEELSTVEQWLASRSFVAIGEIGLDFYWDRSFIAHQYEAFNQQMEWALEYQRPVVIHTRSAMEETIDAVKPYADRGLRGIFHCFGGTYDQAKRIIDLQFLLGIGGVLTYKNAGLGEVMEKIALEHIVLETDAPYLAPVPYRGKRNESSYLQYVVAKLAEIKQAAINEIADVTTNNAEKIFGC